MTHYFYSIIFAITCFISSASIAETNLQGSQVSGDYEIHYSVFPSNFLLPDVAAAYKIKRSQYEALLNISITPRGEHGGHAANITGTVTNLLQQQKILEFTEIKEATATYYLAPVRISGKEVVNFTIDARLIEGDVPLNARFSSELVSQ
ncbi:DUF4426 domain-containing protein [Teredinibacter purpureus]|uniref:DUF4426 domain-containing protein n=1 Tax=Teredinibacter purpureus TaxID=2731756 RepID=UPI0005F839E6|nr:DUF4426 domain-containing protein [Teredinibacter purpureus]